ncbi:hypothetical protein [Desulfosporosinus youngiae]|uniref:Uncharacterized protein n=1 Tax=Desulfosporosinus youngiae DSM 17734 TaxID=768710 RepID=H5XVD0_9FIRM|nr:hypothetical protein [Desulfosporosinus youngiae]EHQ89866.1 hypothetical protein DesyoDRAFT_2817 [Desulfosporosinus youngiae DSM 17734]
MKNEGLSGDIIIESLVQAIPYVGAPLATLYFGQKQEKRFKRLERFYQELKEEIENIGQPLPNISSHNPEELSAILEELHEKVETEHIEVKRRYYKEYFKNTMRFPVKGNFDERKLFLDIMGALTPLQIELVIFLAQQRAAIQASTISKPGVDQALIAGSLAQLKTYGIMEGALNSIVFGGAGNSINENISLSKFGQRFHSFCLNS